MPFAGLRPTLARFSYVPTAALAVAAAWICVGVTLGAFGNTHGLLDFHTFRRAGDAVLHGSSPYPAVDAGLLSGQEQFVYPAPAALVFAAVALLPVTIAAGLWYALSLAAGLGAFVVAGVRDVRVLLTLLCSMWFMHALYVGAVTPFLALGVALAWRWRDTAWRGATVLAIVIGIKLLPAPLILWLWWSGRRAQALRCLAISAALIGGSWALLGFAGFATYPDTLDLLSQLLAWRGYSLTSLALALGAPFATAKLLALAAAAAALALAYRVGPADERQAFLLCIVAALLASPIVWVNYFALVMVGVALHRPGFSWIWVAPIVLGLPYIQSEGHLVPILVWNVALVAVAAACARTSAPSHDSPVAAVAPAHGTVRQARPGGSSRRPARPKGLT
jgi:hypothetical protein